VKESITDTVALGRPVDVKFVPVRWMVDRSSTQCHSFQRV
jgi:hypothetical protein